MADSKGFDFDLIEEQIEENKLDNGEYLVEDNVPEATDPEPPKNPVVALDDDQWNKMFYIADRAASGHKPEQTIDPSKFPMQLKFDTDNYKYRADLQSGWEQAWRSVWTGVASGGLTFAEDLGYIGELFSGQVGTKEQKDVGRIFDDLYSADTNALSEWARENKDALREKYPIYTQEEGSMDFSDPGFRWTLFRDILDSVVGFGMAGGVTSLGVKGIGKLASAAARSSAGIRRAGRTKGFARLLTNPTKGEARFNNAVATGALTNYAEGKMIAYDMFEQTMGALKPYIENGELSFDQAATMAGEKANSIQLLNSAIMFTDMYAISKAIKGVGYTRDVIAKPSLRRAFGEVLGRQGLIEAGEEYYQGILSKEMEYQTLEEYEDLRQETQPGYELREIRDTPKNFASRLGEHMTEPQVLLEAFMGYFGGAGQYAVMKGVNSFGGPSIADHYEEQQKQIALNKKFLDENLYTINDLDKKISLALSTGNELVAKDLQELQMYNIIVNSLVRGVIAGGKGDAKGLIGMAGDVISNPESTEEQKGQAQLLISKAEEMEKDWLASTAYENQSEIFVNSQISRIYDKHIQGLEAERTALISEFDEVAEGKKKKSDEFSTTYSSLKDPSSIEDPDQKKLAVRMAKTRQNKAIDKNEEAIDNYKEAKNKNTKQFDQLTSPEAQGAAKKKRKERESKEREDRKKSNVKAKKDASKNAKKSLKKSVEADDVKETKQEKRKKKSKETFYEDHGNDIGEGLIAVAINNEIPLDELEKYVIDLAKDYENEEEILEELRPAMEFVSEVNQEQLRSDPNFMDFVGNIISGPQSDQIESGMLNTVRQNGGQLSEEDVKGFAATMADRMKQGGAPIDDQAHAALTKYWEAEYNRIMNSVSSENNTRTQMDTMNAQMAEIDTLIANHVSDGTPLEIILDEIKKTFFEGQTLEKDVNGILIDKIKAQARKIKIKGEPTPVFTDAAGVEVERDLENEEDFDEYGLAEPASSLAYLSREYSASGNFMKIIFDEISNQLNENTDARLMSPNYIKEGAKVRGEVDFNSNVETFYEVPADLKGQSELVGLPKNVPWQDLSKALTQLQKSSDPRIAGRAREEFIANVPVRLEIEDLNGETTTAYMHRVPWIQANRVSGKTPQEKMVKAREQREQLYQFREALVDSDTKAFDSEVDFTGKGRLFVDKDGVKRPFVQAIPDPDVPLFTVYRGNLVNKKSKTDSTAGLEIGNRKKARIEGRTYAMLTMGDGSTMLFPMSHQKLSEDMVNTIVKAIDVYSKVVNNEELDETEEAFVKHVRENLKGLKISGKKDSFNIKTTEGIENYIRLFTYTHNLFSETQKSTINEAETLEQWLNNLEADGVPALRVEPNGIDFGTSNEGKVFKAFDWNNDREGYLDSLRTHLGNTYTHVNLDMRGQKAAIPAIIEGDLGFYDQESYDDFMKRNILNTSLSTPAVTINGKTEYLHTIQRVISIDTTERAAREEKVDDQSVEEKSPRKAKAQKKKNKKSKKDKDDFTDLGAMFDGTTDEDYEESFEEGPEVVEDDQAQVLLDIIDDFVIKGLDAKKQSILIDNLAAVKARRVIKEGQSMPRMLQELTLEVKDFLPAKYESEVDKIVEMVRQKIIYDFNLDGRAQNANAEDYDMNKEYDKSDESIFEDPKEKMSKIVKLLFYGVSNPQSQSFGKFKEIIEFQQVFYDIMGIGYNARTIDQLLGLITTDEVLDAYPYMEEIARRINEMSPQNKRRLLVQIQKQPVPMKYVYFASNSKGEYTIRLADDNATDYINYKQQLWKNTLYAGFIASVNPDNEEIVANSDATQALINIFDEWIVNIENEEEAPTAEETKDWLDKIGIEMKIEALENMRENGLRVPRRKNPVMWEEIFTKKFGGGAFGLIASDLKEIIKQKDNEVPWALDRYKIYKMQRQYRALALANKPYDTIVSPHTFMSGNKRISGFAETTFMSEQIRKLQEGDFSRYEDLAFSEGSLWLEKLREDENMQEIFGVFAISKNPIRKKGLQPNPLEKADTPTHEELLWGYYQSEGRDEKAFSSMTFSNKKNLWMLNVIAEKFSHDESGQITDDAIETLYEYIALAEIARMTSFDPTFDYNNKAYQAGANIFYFFPSMNDVTELREEDGSIVENYEAFKPQIKAAIRKDLDGVVTDTIGRWTDAGIISNKDGKLKMAVIDKGHKAALSKRMESKSDAAMVQAAVSDYEANYLLSRVNMFQTIYGDIANYYKEGETTAGTIDATFQNLEKRLAGEVAPGALGESAESDQYNVLVISDAIMESRSLEYYEDLVDKKILTKEDLKSYKKIVSTDAGEMTTLEEHVNILYRFGKMDDDRRKHLLAAGKAKTLSNEEIGYLMKVMKPVQVGVKKEGTVERKIYIKSASYPLIPQMVEGTQLEVLLNFMEGNNIQRVAPESGVKLGATKLSKVFDKDGNILEDIEIGDSILSLNRSDFRIQQETPEKDPFVKRFSQASKLAFMNYMHLTNIKMRGIDEDQNAKDLFDEYIKMVSGSAEASKTKLLNQISTDGKIDNRKVADILRRSAESLGYSRHEVEAFTTVANGKEFLAPLWMLAGSKRFEQIVNSVVNRRVIGDKMPGYGHKLVSEEGWVGEGGTLEGKGIVFTNEWKGHLRSIQEEEGLTTYDIILPWNFQGADMEDFIGSDGKIDASKINSDLLTMFGIRIPTQSVKSMAAVRVVGFLPKGSDMAIGSRDLVPKTGWDFDYDAFYTYHYNTIVGEDGKLEIFDKNTYGALAKDPDRIKVLYKRIRKQLQEYEDIGGAIQETFTEDNYSRPITEADLQALKERFETGDVDIEDESTMRNLVSNMTPENNEQKKLRNSMNEISMLLEGKAHFQNKIIDIHLALMQNEEVMADQARVLEGDKLEDLAKFVAKKTAKPSIVHISSGAQSEAYVKASGAKDMVSIMARLNVFYAMMQTSGSDMSYYHLKFDENGVPEKVYVNIGFAQKKGNAQVNAVRVYQDTKGNEQRSEILSRMLSASVDDAQMQILRRINLSSVTAPIFKGMFWQGFDDQHIVMMLNQPITYYVTAKTRSLIQQGVSPQSALISAIEFADDLYQTEDPKYKVKTYANDLSLAQLKNAIGSNLDKMSRTNLNNQLRILRSMKAFVNVANELSTAEEAANMDSNTASSLIESIERQRIIEENIENTKVDNIMDFIGEFSAEHVTDEGFSPVTKLSQPTMTASTDEQKKEMGISERSIQETKVGFKPLGIAGVVYQSGILLNNEIWLSTNQEDKPTYFYRIPEVAAAIKQINEISRNSAKSPAAIARQSEMATRMLITYILTDVAQQGQTSAALRNQLMITKDSVARRIKALKKEDPENPLLQQISFNVKKDTYELPFLNQTGGDRTLELHMANQLKRLTRKNPELMSDIMRLEMSVGVTTNYFNNIWRMLSPQIMRALGFSAAAYNYNFASIGENKVLADDQLIPVFVEQFFQNSPREAVLLSPGEYAITEGFENVKDEEDQFEFIRRIISGEDLTLTVNDNDKFGYKGEKGSALPYLRIDGGHQYGYVLLKLEEYIPADPSNPASASSRVYKPFYSMGDTFRGGVFREFEPGKPATQSAMNANSLVRSYKPDLTEGTEEKTNENPDEFNARLAEVIGENTTALEALNNMLNSSFANEAANQGIVEMGRAIVENQAGVMGNVGFTLDRRHSKYNQNPEPGQAQRNPLGIYAASKNRVSLFSDAIYNLKNQNTDKTAIGTIVHESIHAYTSKLFITEPALHSEREASFIDEIRVLWNSAKENLSEEELAIVEDIRLNGSSTKLPLEQARTYYPFVNEKEFIAGLFTSSGFVNKLSGMTYQGKDNPKSLLQKIFERIVKLLGIKRGSIAYEAVSALYAFTKTTDGGAPEAFFFDGKKLTMNPGENVRDTINRYEKSGVSAAVPAKDEKPVTSSFAKSYNIDGIVLDKDSETISDEILKNIEAAEDIPIKMTSAQGLIADANVYIYFKEGPVDPATMRIREEAGFNLQMGPEVADGFRMYYSEELQQIVKATDQSQGEKKAIAVMIDTPANMATELRAKIEELGKEGSKILFVSGEDVLHVGELAIQNMQAAMDEVFLTGKNSEGTTVKPLNVTSQTKYKDLSNFAPRQFKYATVEYTSVEQAYQAAKASPMYNGESYINPDDSDFLKNEATKAKIMASTDPAQIKRLGQQIIMDEVGLAEWESDKASWMYQFLLHSLLQNEGPARMLLDTGQAELVHDIGKPDFWTSEFPKSLMDVRNKIKRVFNKEDEYPNQQLPTVLPFDFDESYEEGFTEQASKEYLREGVAKNPLLTNLENQLAAVNKSIGILTQRRDSTDNIARKKTIAKNINNKRNERDVIEKAIREAEDNASSTVMIAQGHLAIEKINDYVLTSEVRSDQDHVEIVKLAEAWSDVSRIYEDTWESPKDAVIKDLAYIERQIKMLEGDLDDAALRKVLDRVNEELNKDFTLEDIIKVDSDESALTRELLDSTMIGSPINQTVDKIVDTARRRANEYFKDVRDNITDLDSQKNADLVSLGLDESIFRQKDTKGRITGSLVTPYSPKFYARQDELLENTQVADTNAEKRAAWKAYDAFKEKNIGTIDIEHLISEDGIVGDQQKIIDELSETHGEVYSERIVKDQVSKLNNFRVDLEMEIEELSQIFSGDELTDAIELWEIRNSPYYYINSKDKWVSEKNVQKLGLSEEAIEYYSISGAGLRMDGNRYLIELPKLQENGKLTEWANKDFRIILENRPLLEFHAYAQEKLEQMRLMSPIGARKRLEKGAIPFFSQQMKQQLLELSSLSRKGKEFTDDFVRRLRDDMRGHGKDLFDPEQNRVINASYIKTEEDQIKEEEQRLTVEFITANEKRPSKEDEKEIYNAAVDVVAGMNMPSLKEVLIAHAANASVYYFKHSSEDILLMMENASKGVIDLSRSKKNDAPVLAKNASAMLSNQLDTYFMVKNEKGQEFGDKIYTYGEKQLKDSFEAELETINKFISKSKTVLAEVDKAYNAKQITGEERDAKYSEVNLTVDPAEKRREEVKNSIENLGGKKTDQGMVEGIAHLYHVKTLGWKLSSGLLNLIYGVTSNFVEGGAGVFYNDAQIASAYKLVTRSILKNVGIHTDTGAKIASLMYKLDVLKEMSSDIEEVREEQAGGFWRRNVLNPYEILKSTEYLNQAPVAVAILMNHTVKNKETGDEINMWEAFNKDGSWDENYEEPTQEEQDLIKTKIDTAIRMIHGNYDPMRRIKVQRGLVGRLASMFRRWIPNGFAGRFKGEFTNHQIGITFKGRYLSYGAGAGLLGGSLFGSLFGGPIGVLGFGIGVFSGKFSNPNRFKPAEEMGIFKELLYVTKQLVKKLMLQGTDFDSKYREVDAQNMRRNLNEIMIILAMWSLKFGFEALKDLLEDNKTAAGANRFMANTADRALKEIAFFVTPKTFMEISQEAIPLLKFLEDMMDLTTAYARTAGGDGTIETGAYVNQNRAWRATKKNFPILNNWYVLDNMTKTKLGGG